MTLDILIPYHGNIPLLQQCLDPLLRSSAYTGLCACAKPTIYLIDDGSPKSLDVSFGTGAIPVKRLRLNERSGFVAAVNHGWSLSSGDIVIVLNSDTIPDAELPGRLAAVFEKEAQIAAAGPVSDNPRDLFQYEPWTRRHQAADAADQGAEAAEALPYIFTDYLTGMCMAVRRAAIKESWLFDPSFSPGYFEDLDLCCKLRHRGWKLAIVPGAYVRHGGAATFGNAPDVQAIRMNNYSKFSARWGHLPEHATLDQYLWG